MWRLTSWFIEEDEGSDIIGGFGSGGVGTGSVDVEGGPESNPIDEVSA